MTDQQIAIGTMALIAGLGLLVWWRTRDPLDGVSRVEIVKRIWAADVIRPSSGHR